MSSHRVTWSDAGNFVGLLIVGLGIGWLVGMSATPVVSIVITSLTATAGAILAVLSGLEDTKGPQSPAADKAPRYHARHVNVAPILALVVGLVIGAAVGLTSRSYGWFGTDLDAEINKWTRHGRSEQEVTAALFAAAYPAPGSGETPNKTWTNDHVGVLFGSSGDLQDTCSALLGVSDADLRKYALGASLEGVQKIAAVVEDPTVLRAVLEVICPSE